MAASSGAVRAPLTTGVNAGFLWKVADQSSIYFISDNGERSPFDNPKFVDAFEKAQVIAFKSLGTDAGKQMRLERLEQLVTETAKSTERHVSAKKIAEYNAKLDQLIQTVPPSPLLRGIKLPQYDNPRMKFFVQLFVCAASVFGPVKERDDLCEAIIKAKAQETGKTVVSLIDEEEEFMLALDVLKKLFSMPALCPYLDAMWFSEKGMKKLQEAYLARGKAWDLGFSSAQEQISLGSSKDEERFEKALSEHYDPITHKSIKNLSLAICKSIEATLELDALELSAKIAAMVEKHPDLMTISSESELKNLFKAFTARKIQVQGPLRETMKPIGFLWEIRKADKVVGHFLGSVHIVPNWVLENFNSQTLDAFKNSNVLGVEVDITREGVAGELANQADSLAEMDEAKKERVRAKIREGLKLHHLELDEADLKFIEKGIQLIVDAIMAKYGTKSGIDLFFIEQAKQRQIEIVDLESIQTQREFLALVKKEESQRFCKELTFQEFEAAFEQAVCKRFPEILEMGITEVLEPQADGKTKEHKEAMNLRNMEMTLTTHQLIRSGKIPFSIAGVNHFVGKDGMNKLMEKLGYKVQQIICEEPRNGAAAVVES